MLEIMTLEQPCIVCEMPLEVVTLFRDDVTGEGRIDRTRLDHDEHTCAARLALYRETFPYTGKVG
jgi:hypothetical protein